MSNVLELSKVLSHPWEQREALARPPTCTYHSVSWVVAGVAICGDLAFGADAMGAVSAVAGAVGVIAARALVERPVTQVRLSRPSCGSRGGLGRGE